MWKGSAAAPEQKSAAQLVDVAWQEFDKRTLALAAQYVLWGSFESADDLTSRFLAIKGEQKLLDKRRRLSEAEQERLGSIQFFAAQASAYRDWVRQEDGDPILRDVLVGYCAAFENCLKAIALAFRVAAARAGEVGQVFIAGDELRGVRKEVLRRWTDCRPAASSSTAQTFFASEIAAKNPSPTRWPLSEPTLQRAHPSLPSSSENWNVVGEAFRLRNSILHQNAYLINQLEFPDETLHAGDLATLSPRLISRVRSAFHSILYEFNPEKL